MARFHDKPLTKEIKKEMNKKVEEIKKEWNLRKEKPSYFDKTLEELDHGQIHTLLNYYLSLIWIKKSVDSLSESDKYDLFATTEGMSELPSEWVSKQMMNTLEVERKKRQRGE